MVAPLIVAGAATAARVGVPRVLPWLGRLFGRGATAAAPVTRLEPVMRAGAVAATGTAVGGALGVAATGTAVLATAISIAAVVLATGLIGWGLYKMFFAEKHSETQVAPALNAPALQPELQPAIAMSPTLPLTPSASISPTFDVPPMMAAQAPYMVQQPIYQGPMMASAPMVAPAMVSAAAPNASHVEALNASVGNAATVTTR